MLEKGKEVGAVFFNFQKAFDTVPHKPLLDKLCTLGLDPQIVKWVHNYLANRKQKVVVNNMSSLPMEVASGVPQGSTCILGPLLFLIFVDDISSVNISNGSKIVLYADDILLYRPITSPEDMQYLQQDIEKLQAYATTNYMKFNESKCVLVSRKKQHIHPVLSIYLNGTPLENIPTFKYLGLIISSDLSWCSHISNICSKAKRILGLIIIQTFLQAIEQAIERSDFAPTLPT